MLIKTLQVDVRHTYFYCMKFLELAFEITFKTVLYPNSYF